MTITEFEKMWSAFGDIPTNSDDETSHSQLWILNSKLLGEFHVTFEKQ